MPARAGNIQHNNELKATHLSIRLGIDGFGRIGRLALRAAMDRAVNASTDLCFTRTRGDADIGHLADRGDRRRPPRGWQRLRRLRFSAPC
jgi:hypothetical protein